MPEADGQDDNTVSPTMCERFESMRRDSLLRLFRRITHPKT